MIPEVSKTVYLKVIYIIMNHRWKIFSLDCLTVRTKVLSHSSLWIEYNWRAVFDLRSSTQGLDEKKDLQ